MTAFLKNQRNLVILALIVSAIGAILILTTPFGGMSVSTADGPRDRFASLGSGYSELLDNVFIVLLTLCMLATALVSFVALRPAQLNHGKVIRTARLLAFLTLGLAVMGGIAYEITRANIGYIEWWLDTGFYAALVVGLVNSILYSVVLRRAPV
jgi:hypothetical protein